MSGLTVGNGEADGGFVGLSDWLSGRLQLNPARNRTIKATIIRCFITTALLGNIANFTFFDAFGSR